MNIVKFQTPIKNGVVHIPKEFKDIKNVDMATFIVIDENQSGENDENIQSLLDEFHNLITKANNKIMVTHKIETNSNK